MHLHQRENLNLNKKNRPVRGGFLNDGGDVKNLGKAHVESRKCMKNKERQICQISLTQ